MEIKVWMRKQQLFKKNQPVVLSGGNPGTIVTSPGMLQNNNWVDYTRFIDGLDQLKLTWTELLDADAKKAPIGNGVKLSASSNLSFELDAYQFIKSWLVDDVAATMNAVEIKIEYVGCTTFENWCIRHSQINWCEDATCVYNATLQQQEEQYKCIENTLINDNHQGWFPTDSRTPANGKKHPRISYCNEVKPNGMLIVQWYLMTTIFASASMFAGIMLTIINPILAILGAIQSLLGANWGIPPPISPKAVLDAWGMYFVESGGCGREHPAPLWRDYISNVCDKCGVIVNANSFPLFFSPTLNIESSTGQISEPNPYYNAVYFYAPRVRGVRRFRNLKPIGYGAHNDTDYWIPENAPDIALSDALDLAKKVFNSEWRIKNGTLYFNRKDAFKNKVPVYDFRPGSPDRAKLVKPVCFRPNAATYPAFTDGLYVEDGGDSCGNEAMDQMNGRAIAFTLYEDQPNFGGKLDKRTEIGATKFNLDGAATCYYYDGLQVVANGGIVALLSIGAFFPWIMINWIQVLQSAGDAFRRYGDFALLLRDENCLLPKILCWDGDSFDNAHAVRGKATWQGVYPLPTPDPNLLYNTSPLPWNVMFKPKTDVVGKNLTFPSSPNGVYRVTDYFGIMISENPALLVNYPMYFNPSFKGTLWDFFHWIDDPRRNPQYNFDFDCRIRLCCEDIQKLGLENDASENEIGEAIRVVAGQYYTDGKITELTVSFDATDPYGFYIEIKGKV